MNSVVLVGMVLDEGRSKKGWLKIEEFMEISGSMIGVDRVLFGSGMRLSLVSIPYDMQCVYGTRSSLSPRTEEGEGDCTEDVVSLLSNVSISLIGSSLLFDSESASLPPSLPLVSTLLSLL